MPSEKYRPNQYEDKKKEKKEIVGELGTKEEMTDEWLGDVSHR